jgi:response regulator of citrate/malate metabolism
MTDQAASQPVTLRQVADDPSAKNREQALSLLRDQAHSLMLLDHFMSKAAAPCIKEHYQRSHSHSATPGGQ